MSHANLDAEGHTFGFYEGQTVSLHDVGDIVERTTWDVLSNYFPAYEHFWRIHIMPLRIPGHIWLRIGIPQHLERLAMSHYTCYGALAKAFQLRDTNDPEIIYVQLQRSAETGHEVVTSFRAIFMDCMGHEPSINSLSLRAMVERLKRYRNCIHQTEIGRKSDTTTGQILIPKPDSLEKYRGWSSLRTAPASDLVPLQEQFWDDFMALCSVIESCWSEMLAQSGQLLKSVRYRKMQSAGSPELQATVIPVIKASSGCW